MATLSSNAHDFDLDAALDRLFSLQTFGIKLGLGPITALLEELGNPHHTFPSVHVAGTNGKGSVCSMVASVLQASGLRVGLYTSPHLTHFSERIRVNGAAMSRERLAEYAREMLPVIERHECTFFEGTTAMGFRYFAEEKVDIAVIETGLGGRLDATNVLAPLVAAITSIGLDHVKHLGDTLEKIAAEKAGIIKPGTPAVVGHLAAPRLREIFIERGAEVDADLRFVDDVSSAIYRSMTPEATIGSFIIDGRAISDLVIDLVGRHQIENARTALVVIDALRERYGITDEAIRDGFASIGERSGIRGRFETVRRDPRVILDVAHNPDGAEVLAGALRSLGLHRTGMIRFVYGAVEDKDVAEVTRILAPVTGKFYAVRADSTRSLPADEIAHHAGRAGIDTVVAGRVSDGLAMALADAASDDTIVVCGSFFVVADAIAAIEHDGEGTPRVAEPGSPLSSESTTKRKKRTASSGPRTKDEPARSGRNGATEKDEKKSRETQSGAENRRPSVKEWSRSEQPRERLMHLGAHALSDAELLAILLRTGMKGEDVVQVSRNLLSRFENFARLSHCDYRELQQIAGVGPTKAVTLAAAFEIAKRIAASPFFGKPIVASPDDIARIYIPKLRSVMKEQFHVLILNSAGRVIRTQLVSEGSLNSSIVHPREVFRTAIVENAAAIIGLHNHPSGNPTPSKEDIAITRQLIEAGDVLNIPFHDHIIIAGEEYVSLMAGGYV